MSDVSPHFFSPKILTIAVLSALSLVGCGGSNDSSTTTPPSKPATGVATLATGELLQDPINTRNFSAQELSQLMQQVNPTLMNAINQPTCGVKVEYMHYDTVDVKGAKTDATGAVFIPTGSDPKCTGKRPIVLHGHGTATTQGYNFAEVGNFDNEAGGGATMMAAMFAGQGYIVVSPNYAGYDKSSLDYHPYLNAQQQSHEMADALKAGRQVLSKINTDTNVADNGKLFLTGYSQGGHVVMATARYLEQLKEPVTAAMPISGPYAMEAFGDVVFGGKVMLGATFFAPLMARNYQVQYGDVYKDPSEIFASANPAAIEKILPSKLMTDELVSSGQLPASAMFQQAPTGDAALDALSPADPAFGFGFSANNYLIKTSYRAAYIADMKKNPDWAIPYLQGLNNIQPIAATSPEHGLRKALKANDLRTYVPMIPTVMCGGNQDPMVFFDVNTGLMNDLWRGYYANIKNTQLGMVDIDITNQSTRQKPVYQSTGLPTILENTIKTTSDSMQKAFAQNLNLVATNAAVNAIKQGATPQQAEQASKYAVMTSYHSMVTPYCMGVAEQVFNQF